MRRVFFSYHYANDISRVDQVRAAWLERRGVSEPWFEDGSLMEKAPTRDDRVLRQMIDEALVGTSVTVVLIGTETANRRFVTYEIEQSLRRGHGLLGVYIHQLKDRSGKTARKGPNPLDKLVVPGTGMPLSTLFATYDWVDDDGCHQLGQWVEEAAGRRLAVSAIAQGPLVCNV